MSLCVTDAKTIRHYDVLVVVLTEMIQFLGNSYAAYMIVVIFYIGIQVNWNLHSES